ncbi:MAG: hypothetical protein ACKOWL_04750 [Sphingobacteriaceae bacterium]
MSRKITYVTILLVVGIFASLKAQNTTNSPYSQFGLGDIKPMLVPQQIGMGGIAVGLRKTGGYSLINVANPASYSSIGLSTMDMGASLDIRTMTKGNASQKITNGTLGHFLVGIPVNKRSALTFGLMPFSDLGYQYRMHTLVDTFKVDHLYSGEGGLSKAHLGYGYQFGKKLSLGFNLSYIFGNLKVRQSAEFPDDPYALATRTQSDKSLGGLNLQYGLQYTLNPAAKSIVTLGYSGTANSRIKSSGSITSYRYRFDAVMQAESEPLDTIYYNPAAESNIHLPQKHAIGITICRPDHWAVGADFSYTKWSALTDGGTNAGLKDAYSMSLGGQYTPDITSVSNYFKLIDYNLGFRYDKTYININNTQINQYALCFGLGLPLPANRSTFYKINLAGELGKRGSLKNGLIKENYLTMHLGFVINDRWFIKTKYD